MDKIKLIIVDNSQVFREGLERMLEVEPSIEVLHTCAVVQADFLQLSKQQPDVMIICIKLGECNGTEAIAQIHELSPQTNMIALCDSDSDVECISAIQAGAKACISRNIAFENLVKVISLVADGEFIISSVMAGMLLEEFKFLEHVKDATHMKNTGVLSNRENAVLNLVAEGFTNREIATMLFISEQTVKVHLRNIMGKLCAHTREHAVALMRGKGWR